MEKKISLSQIETMIRKNIKEKGLMDDISEEKIQEIKNKLKKHLSLPSAMFHSTQMAPPIQLSGPYDIGGDSGSDSGAGGGMEEEVNPEEQNDQNISDPQETTFSNRATCFPPGFLSREEFSKEGIYVSPEIYDKNYIEPVNDSYELKLPGSIEKAEPEKIFIYNENELSLGAESLRTTPFSLVNCPEEKMTMEQMWLEKAKVRAEVYKVEFVKIGEMVFQPNNGICKFERVSEPLPVTVPIEDQAMVQQAISSQEPIEPMQDTIAPVMDVTLPPSNDMGLETANIEKAAMDLISKALQKYLNNS